MLKAVIFDMDGVLIESEPLHYQAYHKMFKDVNIEVPDSLYESFTGKATLNICSELRDIYNLNESPETLVNIKRKHFDYIFENDPDFDLMEGVLDLIKDYHKNGLTMVLGSSATMVSIERIFNKFNLNQYFKAKLSGADLKESKPHPEIFIKAAEATGFNKDECMVIEDATSGIKAAKAAGIFCVGFDSFHSKNQDYSQADLVVKNLEDLHYHKIKHLF